MTKNLKIFTAEKKIFFLDQKGRPSYKRRIQLLKRTSSTSKHNISKFFLFLWFVFALLDPDPECGSGSTDSIRIRNPAEEECLDGGGEGGRRWDARGEEGIGKGKKVMGRREEKNEERERDE